MPSPPGFFGVLIRYPIHRREGTEEMMGTLDVTGSEVSNTRDIACLYLRARRLGQAGGKLSVKHSLTRLGFTSERLIVYTQM